MNSKSTNCHDNPELQSSTNNTKKMPKSLKYQVPNDTSHPEHSAETGTNQECPKQGQNSHPVSYDEKPLTENSPCTVLNLFKTPHIRKYTVVMFYLWFVASLSYFGILFSTPTLHGDLFINFAISGAVEIPACLCNMFVLHRIGRRKPVVCFMLLCGVMNVTTIFIPEKTDSGVDLRWLIITAAMIGKFGITGAYSAVYLMAAEIFPTSVRNQAVGMSSFFENCGSIFAPFVVFWAKSLTSLPFVLFGSLTMLGGLLALILPETNNKALPETLHSTVAEPDENPIIVSNGTSCDRT